MIRDTSIETYREIMESGLLSKMRQVTYELLYKYGPCTASELMDHAKRSHEYWSHETIETIGRRLPELAKLGVAIEVSKRPSKTTGRMAYVWKTTDQKPVKFDKAKREKCLRCDGRGYIETQQAKMF